MRQVKANFPVLSVQLGGELPNQEVSPSPGLLTMPSRLPFLDESASSILADGLLRASNFLQVGTSKLLAELNVPCLSSANKSIGGTLARTNAALVETVLYAETILSTTDSVMITVIVIDFMGLYGENPTEFGKYSSHICLHAYDVRKNLRWMQ